MTPVHVNIATDVTEGQSCHIMLPPGGSGIGPSDEVPTPQNNPPGRAKHKITTTVLHRGLGIVQHGHDIGACIPDAAPAGLPAWVNGYLPIILLKSSRKVMFAASTVKAEGTPVGGAHISPNLPMLSCGEPLPLPITYPTTNATNTLLVGLSATDITRGWEDITDAIVIEAICLVISPVQGIEDILTGIVGVDAKKSGLAAAVGLLRSIDRSAESGWTEPISLKIETGGPAAGNGAEVKWTPATGEADLTAEGNVGAAKWSAGAKRDADGNWKGTGDLPPDLFEG